MALSFLVPHSTLTSPRKEADGAWAFFGGDLKIYSVSNDGHQYTSRQVFKANSAHAGKGRKSIATPPLHYHLYQSETFEVNAGRMVYVLDGKEGTLDPGQTVTVPPLRSHTFWSDESGNEDLDVTITVRGGPNPGFDESFVHNFYGYLSSKVMAGELANPLQIFRFLYSADVVVAEVPFGLGRVLNWFFGLVVGEYLLGFKAHYKVFEVAE
ncbi:hypothetical protein IAU60_005578 [Kwoniella sp. DSM 27419]